MNKEAKITKLIDGTVLQLYSYLNNTMDLIEGFSGSEIKNISIDINRTSSGDNIILLIDQKDYFRSTSRAFIKPITTSKKTIEDKEVKQTEEVANSIPETRFNKNTIQKLPSIFKMLKDGESIKNVAKANNLSIKTIKKIINLYNIDHKDTKQLTLFEDQEKVDKDALSMEQETKILEDLIVGKTILEIAMKQNVPSMEVERIENQYKDFIEKKQNNVYSKPKSKEEKGRILDDRIEMASKGLIV